MILMKACIKGGFAPITFARQRIITAEFRENTADKPVSEIGPVLEDYRKKLNPKLWSIVNRPF